MPIISPLSRYSASGHNPMQGGASPIQHVDAITALSNQSGGASQQPSAQALANALVEQAKTGLEAVLISLPKDGKVTLNIAGQSLSLALPPEVAAAYAKNSALFALGQHIGVDVDAQSQNLRILWPNVATQTGRNPATILELTPRAVQTHAASTTAPAHSQAQNAVQFGAPSLPFPPGSIAHTIAKLAGFAFPLLESSSVMQTGIDQGSHAQLAASARLAAHSAFRPQSTAPSPAALAALPEGLAQEALRAAMGQSGIGQAIASLLTLTAKMNTPEAALLAQLANVRLDAKSKPDGARLREAFRASGVFMEAGLAQAAQHIEGGQAHQELDMKALFLGLKANLGARSASASTSAEQPEQSQGDAALLEARSLALRHVSGAIERIKLMQIASVPDHPDIIHNDDVAQPTRLSLAIPLALEGRENAATAMLGLVVEHHPLQSMPFEQGERAEGEGGQEHAYPWIIRLALDAQETGSVQAEIGLRGTAIGITLWMERDGLAEEARAHSATLHTALQEAAFESINLTIKEGHPPAHSASTFRHAMLDQRT